MPMGFSTIISPEQWGGGPASKVGRPKRDRSKVKAGRKAAKSRR
jgi:hypothetical protein